MNIKKLIKTKISSLDKTNQKYIILVGVITIVLSLWQFFVINNSENISEDDLVRPGITEDKKALDILVAAKDSNEYLDVSVDINPLQYSENQAFEVFEELYEKLKVIILNGNESLSKISGNLKLVTEVEGYPVILQWFSSDYETINYDGTVSNKNVMQGENISIILTVIMEYLEYSAKYEYYVEVCAPVISGEADADFLRDYINSEVNKDMTESVITLPESAGDIKLTYRKPKDFKAPVMLMFMGFLAIAVIIVGDKKNKETQKSKRKEQLRYDYSEMIVKLTLLCSAGMTVRRAWEKIVMDYRQQKQRNPSLSRCVYEEMEESYNQLKTGLSEAAVYESFGNRCDTKEYMKFSTLLVQNMRKGTRELVNMLETEAVDAFEERKNQAKRYGEEAGTKLLLPMVMMFSIVLAVIMVPAILSFNL